MHDNLRLCIRKWNSVLKLSKSETAPEYFKDQVEIGKYENKQKGEQTLEYFLNTQWGDEPSLFISEIGHKLSSVYYGLCSLEPRKMRVPYSDRSVRPSMPASVRLERNGTAHFIEGPVRKKWLSPFYSTYSPNLHELFILT